MTQTKRPSYMLWMLCVFMLLSAASYFFRPKEPEISYAEVVQLFEQEKVKSFTVQDTTLTLKLREAVDGKTELRKELYDFNLFYDDLNDLVVEQKAAGILEDYNYSANHSPNYLAIALPYVIAVAGLFAIWYFFSMRASGGGNDRMAKFGNATFRHGSESARRTSAGGKGYSGENRQQAVSDISRMLKIMAKELQVPVLCLSQLSRANEKRDDKRPMLSDLRESGAIEQDADIVLFLYRDDYYNEDSEKHNIAECIVAKNRHGETGKVELRWMPEYTTFGTLERRYEDE